jgi:hypothetical protein
MDETVFDDIPEITPIDSYNIEEASGTPFKHASMWPNNSSNQNP